MSYIDQLLGKEIYHYTSVENFEKIIKSKELWMGDLAMCNDTMEQKWLLELIKSAPQKKYLLDLCELLHETFIEERKTFAICFSLDSDNLSLWRGYGDFSKGVALCFSLLNEISTDIDLSDLTGIYGVKYIDKRNEKEVDEAIKNLEKMLEAWERLRKQLKEDVPEKKDDIDRNILGNVVIQFASENYKIKHHAFKEEQEVRLIKFIEKKRIKEEFMKASQNSFVSIGNKIFDKFSVSQTPVTGNMLISQGSANYPLIFTGVKLGPICPLSEAAVENLLLSNGFSGIKITKSEIPFR